MRQIRSFLIAAVLCIALVMPSLVVAQNDAIQMGIWVKCPIPDALSGEIKVGVVAELKGNTDVSGVLSRRGADIAMWEINAAGYLGDAEMVLIAEHAADTDTAVATVTKLIEQDHVIAVLGPTFASQAFATYPMIAAAGIPVIGLTLTAPDITTQTDDAELNQFMFRVSMPEARVIPGTIAAAADLLGIEQVAVLYGADNDLTLSTYGVFRDALLDEGIAVTVEETFSRGEADFRPQLTPIIDSEPDALVVAALVDDAIQIVIQARQLGYDGPIIGGDSFNTPVLIAEAGDAANKVLVGAAWNRHTDYPPNNQFVTDYGNAVGVYPDQSVAQGYTGTWLLATALRCANSSDPAQVRDALAAIENFDSPLGIFAFDEDRNPVHDTVVQIIYEGEFNLFDERYVGVFD